MPGPSRRAIIKAGMALTGSLATPSTNIQAATVVKVEVPPPGWRPPAVVRLMSFSSGRNYIGSRHACYLNDGARYLGNFFPSITTIHFDVGAAVTSYLERPNQVPVYIYHDLHKLADHKGTDTLRLSDLAPDIISAADAIYGEKRSREETEENKNWNACTSESAKLFSDMGLETINDVVTFFNEVWEKVSVYLLDHPHLMPEMGSESLCNYLGYMFQNKAWNPALGQRIFSCAVEAERALVEAEAEKPYPSRRAQTLYYYKPNQIQPATRAAPALPETTRLRKGRLQLLAQKKDDEIKNGFVKELTCTNKFLPRRFHLGPPKNHGKLTFVDIHYLCMQICWRSDDRTKKLDAHNIRATTLAEEREDGSVVIETRDSDLIDCLEKFPSGRTPLPFPRRHSAVYAL